MKRDRQRQQGQALVELGITIVMFVTLVMGMLEFGRAWMIANMITHAARDGGRIAAVIPTTGRDSSGTITNTSAIVNQVRSEIANVMDANGLSVVVDQPTVNGVNLVRVTVNGSVPYMFNLLGQNSFQVARAVTFRDEGRP